MKTLIVLSALVLSVIARPQSQPQYGVPMRNSIGGGNRGSGSGGYSNNLGPSGSLSLENALGALGMGGGLGGNMALGGGGSGLSDGPKVYKHISVHVAPKEEFDMPRTRVIRPMMNQDKHVNIIFVKAPSASSAQQTEVILPEQPESKTIVYLLVRKSQGQNDIKIRQPTPTRPPKPEVYFIKYNKPGQGQGQGAAAGLGAGSGSAGAAAGRPQYGVPA